jgi:hypothetical protein
MMPQDIKTMAVSEIIAKAEALERLTAACARACEALEKLGGAKHGGIKIKMVGDVVDLTVASMQADRLTSRYKTL